MIGIIVSKVKYISRLVDWEIDRCNMIKNCAQSKIWWSIYRKRSKTSNEVFMSILKISSLQIYLVYGLCTFDNMDILLSPKRDKNQKEQNVKSWDTNPWSIFCDPHWELICHNKSPKHHITRSSSRDTIPWVIYD